MQTGLYTSDVVTTYLRSSGERLRLRQLQAGDSGRLRQFGGRLSPETLYRRFMSPAPRCEWLLPRLMDVDHWDREAIVALAGEEIVAVARYGRKPGAGAADVSVVVADDWQHRGLGRLLLGRLARLARRRGIAAFTGTIAGENYPAQRLVGALAPGIRFRAESGEVEFEAPLTSPGA
jgi:GNAT superfamily N-acetyltransferase